MQYVDTIGVEITYDVHLPALIREQITVAGRIFLDTLGFQYGAAGLHIHIRKVGRRYGCFVHLFTAAGGFHAFSDSWDVRKAIARCLDSLAYQTEAQHINPGLHA